MSFFDRDSEYKVVILMRQDVKMSKGKSAAQACHAAVACALASKKKNPSAFAEWDGCGQKIAALKMRDLNAASLEAAMSMIAGTARSMGVVVGE